jgi:hypothetical protein
VDDLTPRAQLKSATGSPFLRIFFYVDENKWLLEINMLCLYDKTLKCLII